MLKLRLVVHEVAALSPRTMRAITANTLRMARIDRRDRATETSPAAAFSAGSFLTGAPVDADGRCVGATVAFERATLEVLVMADDLVRLSWGPDDEPVPWSIAPRPELPALGEVEVEIAEGSVLVRSTALTVRIDETGVVITDDAGHPRYHELPPLRRGVGRVHRRILREGERVAGLGEQAAGLDLRGETIRLWNRDPGGAWGPGQNPLYCSIPVLLSRHRDGDVLAFHENSSDATVSLSPARPGATSDVEIRFVGGMVRSWVAVGDRTSLLERYTGLTGRHELPPRWALGYHQSRWGYSSSEELRAILDGFRERGIPLSVLHLDIDYMDRYRVFSVDEERFGGLRRLSEDAARQGARLVPIVDPAIVREPGYDVYDEGIAHGHFVTEDDGKVHVGTVWPGWAVFPDFTAEATRDWWASKYRGLFEHGIAGLWHDMNEPTSITLSGDRTIPRSARHDNDGRGGDHREAHNVYGMLMNRAGRSALEHFLPGRRPFIVSRSGWAGMQRDAWNWTADVEATDRGLAQQLPTFLGLGLSGVAFTGSDIGGFSGVPSPALYVRWLELGILSPFCRTHSVLAAPPREPWCWPEPFATQVGALICLRYRLLPYLYTEAARTARSGVPFLRPLWWASAGTDSELDDVEDALFVGERLVFAQITEEADASRPVTLPEGRWWLWRALPAISGGHADEVEVFEGSGPHEVEGRLGQPLLFVAGGSIIPLDDAWRAGTRPAAGLSDDHSPGALSFHIFPDADGRASGENFDDAGDGDGPTRRDHLELADGVLSWEREGGYPAPEQVAIVIRGLHVSAAVADGLPLAPGALSTDGSTTTIRCAPFSRLEIS